jgi:predicted amidohydrolase YtcJ
VKQELKSALRHITLYTVVAIAGCGGDAPQPAADIVLENGRIYTVDASRSWAEAVAIKDGRFVYVGSDAGVEKLKGPATDTHDLGGRMVLPGMFDLHIHAMGSGIEKLHCDLTLEAMIEEAGTPPDDLVADYLARIERCAASRPDDEWVVG